MTAPALRLTGTARVGGRVLFGPLDLAVPGGGWCCLLGPSGAGKSSLLHLLAGTSGAVTLDGSARAGDGAPLAGRVALIAIPAAFGIGVSCGLPRCLSLRSAARKRSPAAFGGKSLGA